MDDDEAPRLTLDGKFYMTPTGHAQLREELVTLMNVERPRVVNVVSWAAANGDRSENADYQYGKRRLSEIDRRARFLVKRVEDAIARIATALIKARARRGDLALLWQKFSQGYAELNHLRQCGQREGRARVM